MKPRIYDIKKITAKSHKHRKAAWICAILSVVLIAVLVVVAFNASTWRMENSLLAEQEQILEDAESQAKDVNLSEKLRNSTVQAVVDGETIPAYTTSQVRSLDVSQPSGATVADLKLCTKGALRGLEEDFWQAEQDYGINCLFVMAIASHESANGTICFRKNNMFGFGRSGFSSKAEGIDVVSRCLANKYLNPGSGLYHGKTVDGVHRSYAASSTWDDKVIRNMVKYYAIISQNHNKAIENLK